MLEGFYCLDVESTGLIFDKHEPIEISIIRLSDDVQKTWWLKPINTNTISADALRVNGHKLEDLLYHTKYGRDTYQDPHKVIVDIENWLMEDNLSTENRFLVGQNISFDKYMLEYLWRKCNSQDSFPFGRRVLDTMQFEVLMDLATGKKGEGYSLSNIIKKYGIKNDKAHTAAADTKATKEVFIKQLDVMKRLVNKQ